MQNFMRINSYVLNIFYRMSFKENIWRKLILSTLLKKFWHILARFLSALKLSVIKYHLMKRIKLFPVWSHFFNPLLIGLCVISNSLTPHSVDGLLPPREVNVKLIRHSLIDCMVFIQFNGEQQKLWMKSGTTWEISW